MPSRSLSSSGDAGGLEALWSLAMIYSLKCLPWMGAIRVRVLVNLSAFISVSHFPSLRIVRTYVVSEIPAVIVSSNVTKLVEIFIVSHYYYSNCQLIQNSLIQ